MTQQRSRLARIARILLVYLLCMFLIVEVGLRFVQVSPLTMAELNPSYEESEAHHRTQPHPYLGYRLKPDWSSGPDAKHVTNHNSLGLRGPETTWEKPEGVTRVLCVGGSSTYGHTPSTDEATWPARLQDHLRAAYPEREIEVINGGASGYSTFETLIHLELRLLDLEPDLVIVYHGINDARAALYKEPQRDNSHWRAVWPVFRASPAERLFEKSMTYLIWRRYFTDYTTARADLGFAAIVDYDPTDKNPYANDEYSEQGLTSFRRNLRNIVAVTRERGADLLFATQGLDKSDLDQHDSKKNQLEVLARLQDILREEGAALNVPVLEAAEVLETEWKRQLDETGEQDVFTLDVHLQDPGADLLARTFADRIVADELLP